MAGIKTIIGLSFVRVSGRILATRLLGRTRILILHLLDPSDRLPAGHPLRGPLQKLPDAPRCRNIRNRTITELALRASGEPG